jgi:hypothetical protein
MTPWFSLACTATATILRMVANRRDGAFGPGSWSPSAISGSASFGRCDYETAQGHVRRRTRRPRTTNDCRHTDCAQGNCGCVGRCGRATGRRRRGFPAGCPCLARRDSEFVRGLTGDSPPIYSTPRTFPESNVGPATIRFTYCPEIWYLLRSAMNVVNLIAPLPSPPLPSPTLVVAAT